MLDKTKPRKIFMNAIELINVSKSFRGLYAVDDLTMTVPQGAIYGFIGENGSGKSTTEKLICGHLVPDSGEIRLFGRDYTDPGVRIRVGALIENAGCFPSSSVYQNLKMQAVNLGIPNADEEIERVLKTVRMQDAAHIKFKNCSLGMKQRVGIAMALLGNPLLLILDEPINGLDADGMRVMREILVDITKNCGATVLIASHVLGELEKIATHYGILRRGKLVQELTAEEMENSAKVFISLSCTDNEKANELLQEKYPHVERESETIQVYDVENAEEVAAFLLERNQELVTLKKNKIGLEEYYVRLMSRKEQA